MLIGGFPPIAQLIARLIVILVATTVHEFAHAYGAYRMGDTTARDAGRMTLDPRANLNPIGILMWVVIGFGILGSAPVNEYRMRDRRWGMLVAVAAGPLSNLGLAILGAIPFRLGLVHLQSYGPRDFLPNASQFMTEWMILNILLFLFNLLPLFPLDGWTILLKLLPPESSYSLAKYQRESMYVLYGLIFLSFAWAFLPLPYSLNPLSWLIGQPMSIIFRVLTGGG